MADVRVEALAGQKVKQVSAGSEHSLFLMEDGRVYAAGDNTSGQIGTL